ncbi:MAG: glutathione S-transferase [Rhizobiales bacterium PAR1]|nr:MAG: glutathione S-transferase [Rhizobiales bacterium PAR1]
MPLKNDAPIQISAFSWLPPFAHGVARDIRVRWALEEAGLDYRTRLVDPRQPKTEDYLAEHPFGQVPSYRDSEGTMFESGAIVLHIAQNCPALLPEESQARKRATIWVFAALNTLEPAIFPLVDLEIFHANASWAAERRPAFRERALSRLAVLERTLGNKHWLEGQFTVADLMMVHVLRFLRPTNVIGEFPRLVAYQARGEARPAFQRALADHLAALSAAAS